MADLPDISPDLNQPLPQVDPNSDLVPYRTSSTQPGQLPVVTTGYGPRARPIQPPSGGGVGVPDMTGFLGEAMQHLPVDQAIKAAEMATRFIGQRGYMRDIQNGANAAQAFAKWGPMLFHQATGIPEAIDRSVPTPITPYQQAQLAVRRQQMQAQADAAKAKAEASTKMTPYQQAQIDLRKKAQEEAIKKAEKPKAEKKSTITIPLDPANPDGAKISGPSDDPDVAAAVAKHQEFFKPKPPPPPAPGLVQRAKTALGIGTAPVVTPVQPAVSTQEFVPDTSKAAPPPSEAPIAPAKAQRKIGVTYKTPKGLYTWTENGWVKAGDGK